MTATTSETHLSGIVLNNLMALWNQATIAERKQGRDWYFSARRTVGKLAGKYDLPPSTVAGIIAALSPGMEWTRNIEETERFIKTAGMDHYSVYGRLNDQKARDILTHPTESPLDFLGGPKTRAFYQCIMNPADDSIVVIDSHAWCAGLNRTNGRWDKTIRVTSSRAWWMGRHYQHCARTLGLYPSEFQATIWIVWKRLQSTEVNG